MRPSHGEALLADASMLVSWPARRWLAAAFVYAVVAGLATGVIANLLFGLAMVALLGWALQVRVTGEVSYPIPALAASE